MPARWWWVALGTILLWGVVSQVLILNEAWRKNPLARIPVVDAETYWDWAGDVASGQLVDSTPYMSAPLYPYVIGAVRALGGGLLSVYVFQAALHVVTLGLLAYGAAKRFGAAAGLLAAALFALSMEPAFFTGRVLNCTLQLFLVVLLWLSLLRAQARPSLPRWALAGFLLGLNCLADSPMMVAIPPLGLWAWWQGGWSRRGLGGAALLAAVALLAISPATLHNYRASGEFIPISAQAGVTFAEGNAANATGTYTPVTGITPNRKMQNRDALLLYRQSTGEAGTWNGINRFFFRQGLDFWSSHPAAALRLILCKLYLFMAGRYSSDIYVPSIETQEGVARWLRAAPLDVAWLTVPALAALVVLACKPRRYGPELVLSVVPLAVVVSFFYSPRYRLPAIPIVVASCAWAAARAMQWRTHRGWAIALPITFALGVGLVFVGQVYGLDSLDAIRAHAYQRLGTAFANTGQAEKAMTQFQKALACNPGDATAMSDLAAAIWNLGWSEDSIELRRIAVRAHANRADETEAIRQYQEKLSIDPEYADAHAALGKLLHRRGDLDGALKHLRAAAALNPKLLEVQVELAQLLWDRGDAREAITAMRAAHALAPNHAGISNNLAWYLATAPNLSPADRAEALQVMPPSPEDSSGHAAVFLDTRAAALAANGRFAEAVQALEKALTVAERAGVKGMIADLRSRLELYQAGRPYVHSAKPATP